MPPQPTMTPPIPLTLDRPRLLRLDKRMLFRAERELCTLWGKQVNLLAMFGELSTLTLNDLSVLLWMALLNDDPFLTLEQTQDLMDFDKLPAIMEALFTAWNAATQSASPVPEGGNQQEGPLSFPGAVSGPLPVLS